MNSSLTGGGPRAGLPNLPRRKHILIARFVPLLSLPPFLAAASFPQHEIFESEPSFPRGK